MKIAVTGALGFIGQYVLPLLVTSGHEVFGLTRRHGVRSSDGVRWITANLLDEKSTCTAIEAIRPDSMLHLAWYTKHGHFWASAENFSWCEATIRLLEIFHRVGGRRIVIGGTCAEYDWSYGYCIEDKTPTVPQTIYGKCKNVTRQYAQRYCQLHDLELAWGRIFFPYGPGEPEGRFVPSILNALALGNTVRCSHGRQFRDFIHASDVASALVHMLISFNESGVFNIGSGEPRRLASVVNLCASRFQRAAKIDLGSIPVSDEEPPMLVANIEKLLATGWQPTISIDQGIDDYIASYGHHLSKQND